MGPWSSGPFHGPPPPSDLQAAHQILLVPELYCGWLGRWDTGQDALSPLGSVDGLTLTAALTNVRMAPECWFGLISVSTERAVHRDRFCSVVYKMSMRKSVRHELILLQASHVIKGMEVYVFYSILG